MHPAPRAASIASVISSCEAMPIDIIKSKTPMQPLKDVYQIYFRLIGTMPVELFMGNSSDRAFRGFRANYIIQNDLL